MNKLAALLPLALFTACSGAGTWEVDVYGEEFVEDGIPADEMIDGWRVDFDRFDVHFEDVQARVDEVPLGGEVTDATLDLAISSTGAGHALTRLEVPAGPLPLVDYAIGPAEDGCTLRVEGRALRGDDEKSFTWCFTEPARYVDCDADAIVEAEGRARTELTVHADHLFYDDLVSEEPNVAFDLIAAADLDDDGEITEAELRAADIRAQDRYQVGNNTEVEDLWAFMEAQSTTVGHINGEGHCERE